MKRTAIVVLFLALGGCLLDPAPECGSCSPLPADTSAQDAAQYEATATQLASTRSNFLSRAYSYPRAVGNSLYTYSFPSWDAVLHRYDGTTGRRVDYQFSIGPGADGANFRASDAWVVTARRDGLAVRYAVYDASQANTEVGSLAVPAPSSGQRWWAYAVSGTSVYLVTEEGTPRTAWLNRWSPGHPLERLWALAQATRGELGEFLDFDVEGDSMLFVEGGRLWKASIGAGTATWLGNQTELSGSVDFRADRVLWQAADALWTLDVASGQVLNVTQAINESDYRLNASYPTLHRYDGDFARWKSWVIYKASGGLFAFHLLTHEVRPVLLTPHDPDLRVVYRYPAPLTNGDLFVTALESTSGSVGADGPIYRMSLSAILDER